jgi:WD40 repeat protein
VVFDGKTHAYRRSIEGAAPNSYVKALAFTRDGRIVTGDHKGLVRLHDPSTGKLVATIDTAKDRTRKPEIDAIATSARHLAVARNDGTVAIVDARSRQVVARHDRHVVDSYGGQFGLEAVAFACDGRMVWVSAPVKGRPPGLTGYAI